MSQKQERINKILDDAAKALKAEGVKYFMGVVDLQPKDPEGGKAYSQLDITGKEMPYILDMAFPTRQDKVDLGIWVGQILTAHARVIKNRKNGT